MSEYYGDGFVHPKNSDMERYYLQKCIEYSNISTMLKLNALKIDSALRSTSHDIDSLRSKLKAYKQENELLKKKNNFLENRLHEYTSNSSHYKDLVHQLEHKIKVLQEEKSMYESETSRLKTQLLLVSSPKNENNGFIHNSFQDPSRQTKDSIIYANYKVPSKQSIFRQNSFNSNNINLQTSNSSNFQYKQYQSNHYNKPITATQEYREYPYFDSMAKVAKENRRMR